MYVFPAKKISGPGVHRSSSLDPLESKVKSITHAFYAADRPALVAMPTLPFIRMDKQCERYMIITLLTPTEEGATMQGLWGVNEASSSSCVGRCDNQLSTP